MSWIKTTDMLPPEHEIIIFTDESNNQHYGVLCGQFSKESHRGKFWCHLFQKNYDKNEILYWSEIPINKHLISAKLDFAQKVNEFLHESLIKIENEIIEQFEQLQQENPIWQPENFVRIAVRNFNCKVNKILQVTNLN